jgi:hypothetical protein
MRYQAKLTHRPRQFAALLAALAGSLLILNVGGALVADADVATANAVMWVLVVLTLVWVALTGLSQSAIVVWTVSDEAIHEVVSPRCSRLPFGLRSERVVALDTVRRWTVDRRGFASEQRQVIVLGLADQSTYHIHSYGRNADPAFIALLDHLEERLGPMHVD